MVEALAAPAIPPHEFTAIVHGIVPLAPPDRPLSAPLIMQDGTRGVGYVWADRQDLSLTTAEIVPLGITPEGCLSVAALIKKVGQAEPGPRMDLGGYMGTMSGVCINDARVYGHIITHTRWSDGRILDLVAAYRRMRLVTLRALMFNGVVNLDHYTGILGL
ncbi:MAG TPA: hypothetical protein VLF71_04810 [Candidatus Saccharimonadales bacterium]|nr:hypothetical protein [Candidatus Saccharimonadales bacterium]